MPKPASAYASRLDEALRVCAEVAGEAGYVTARLLAERMGVTDRMARNYLVDLLEAGALEYVGGGRYSLSSAARAKLGESEALGGRLGVEAVAAAGGWAPEVLEFMLERVYRLGSALRGLGDRGDLRRRLLGLGPPGDFVGDRLVYSAGEVEPRELGRIAGEACDYELRSYVVAALVPLTVAYVCSVAAVVKLGEGGQVEAVEFLRKPEVRDFRESEPLDGGLVELAVEHPELLLAGRRVAARLLAARLKLINVARAVERGVELAVSRGTLLPHGFVPPWGGALGRLHEEVSLKYGELVRRAGEGGTTLASIVDEPRDSRFYEAVRRELGLGPPRVSDGAFLSYALEPWEFTAPMRVAEERGRRVEGWFEFYWKVGRRVVKVEYVSAGDPLEVQLELVGALAPNMQVGGRPTGVAEAEAEARRHLGWVRRAFEQAMRRALGSGA